MTTVGPTDNSKQTVKAYSGWEINRICLDLYEGEKLAYVIDMTTAEAVELMVQLQIALDHFNQMNELYEKDSKTWPCGVPISSFEKVDK